MLSFASSDAMNTTLNSLETECNTYDADFLDEHPGYSIDSLNDLQDSINYNIDQPLIDFENQFTGFSSLRKKIAGDISTWLENDGVNMSAYPDNHFITEEGIRTLVNEKGEFKIVDTIYILHDSGWVEVYNADMAVVHDIENGTIDANATPTETTLSIWKNAVLFRPNCDNARSGKRDDGDEYNGSTDRRIYWKLVAENVFIWHRVVGKVQGYHKKRGKWRSYRSDLWVKVEGTVYSKKDCTSTPFDMASDASFPSPVTHSKVREKAVAPFGVPICIMKNDVHGTHLGAGGIVKYSVLTW